MSALGYTLRPMSIMYILLIIIRDRMFNLYLIYAPMIFNTLISFSAFFCDIAFSYDANNVMRLMLQEIRILLVRLSISI